MPTPIEIKVPDIGDFDAVEIIEILVTEGAQVNAEDALLTLESDKASMEIPSPVSGRVETITVALGDKVSAGQVVLLLTPSATDSSPGAAKLPTTPQQPQTQPATEPTAARAQPPPPQESPQESPQAPPQESPQTPALATLAYASPSIRRLARELGAALSEIRGSGNKGRITEQDVKNWVKQQLGRAAHAPGQPPASGGIPPLPTIDFSQFGHTDTIPLSRIKKLAGPHLQRAWLNIPHVTHHDVADITELEAFRKSLKADAEQRGVRLTLLAFAVKVLVDALKAFPTFNASLHPDGQQLIQKRYFNIGIAMDTPMGLVVPVLKQVEQKSLFALAAEMAELSQRARAGKLKPSDLQGGCMSISSLGGIGGRAFTPIVNAPEVAILGIARAYLAPQWDGQTFQPRLTLPLSLSYDHRVIDGADAARFTTHLTTLFADIRRLLI